MEPHTAARATSPLEVVRNRREPAAHPGPAILRDYLTPLGFDAAGLAPQIGIDASRLQRMLAGNETIDVESAIRLARSLQINPRTIVERQARHDFARLRQDEELEAVPVLRNDGRVSFPETGFISGRLAGLRENSLYGGVRDETLGFFADGADGGYPPSHAYSIDVGAMLRVYDAEGAVIYVGVVMRTLEGRPLLPFVRPSEWIDWFTNRHRADYVEPS
jgi:addiction module HigA family antidote